MCKFARVYVLKCFNETLKVKKFGEMDFFLFFPFIPRDEEEEVESKHDELERKWSEKA